MDPYGPFYGENISKWSQNGPKNGPKMAQTQLWLFRLRGVLVHIQWRWPRAARKRPETRSLVALKNNGAAEVRSTGAPAGCPTPNASVSSLSPDELPDPNICSPEKNISLLTADTHISYTSTIHGLDLHTLQQQS